MGADQGSRLDLSTQTGITHSCRGGLKGGCETDSVEIDLWGGCVSIVLIGNAGLDRNEL